MMAGLNMIVKQDTRLCTVNDEHGYFHTWEQYSKPLPASPMIGGQPAGVFSQVFGIVEFKDGVRRTDPTDIVFCDEENAALPHISKEQIAERHRETGECPESDITDIRDILIHADAISCNVTSYESQLYASKAMFEIPRGYNVTVDFNKLAKALYDAGYRKEGRRD